eukprot:1368444-Amorphochlora_amoeboformis.AAC.1
MEETGRNLSREKDLTVAVPRISNGYPAFDHIEGRMGSIILYGRLCRAHRSPQMRWKFSNKTTCELNMYVQTQDLKHRHEYGSNFIRTTRYRWWNFLFKNLFEQFQKAANFYFLIMAIITSVPGVSTIPPYATITPLAFVLAVTAIKDGIDDYKRGRNDSEVNARRTEVLKPGGGTTALTWQDLQVGHVVKVCYEHMGCCRWLDHQISQVFQDGIFPADLVLLASSTPNGECGIQTANLDGETNIKGRQ